MRLILSLIIAISFVAASAQDKTIVNANGAVTQHKWTKYEYVDTCTARYAVVHDWNGRCGIYDLEKKMNITELEYRSLNFSGMSEQEDGSKTTEFIGQKGHRKGIVSVGAFGDVTAHLQLDENLVYSLDSCSTIDEKIMRLSRNLLKEDMKKYGGFNGQVLVMESQTGNIKAWIALEDELHNGNITDAPLLKNQLCTDPQKAFLATLALVESNTSWTDSVDTKCGIDSIGDMLIKDHNWHRGGYGKVTYLDGFKKHSNIAMLRAIEKTARTSIRHEWWNVADRPRTLDALSVATMYNLVALDGKKIVIPSVNTEAIQTISPNEYQEKDIKMCHMMKEYLKATLQDEGIGSHWTTKNVDISGDYVIQLNCRPTLFDDNLADADKYHSKEGYKNYSQIIFTGYFPSDTPRYTICVTMDKNVGPTGGKHVSNTVNKLAEFLIKN